MKNLIIENFELNELSTDELNSINGGGVWPFVRDLVLGKIIDHFLYDADWEAYGTRLYSTGSPGGHK